MNTNGYKDAFWRIIPILTMILVSLIGVVWAITYSELSHRMNRIDDIILIQNESIARIEAKLDILIDGQTDARK
ncbi:hypothetical protein DRQ36_06555 [bacterium]|nr:MAG: hypothetical protein DRQ36_06555 [bacterium]